MLSNVVNPAGIQFLCFYLHFQVHVSSDGDTRGCRTPKLMDLVFSYSAFVGTGILKSRMLATKLGHVEAHLPLAC